MWVMSSCANKSLVIIGMEKMQLGMCIRTGVVCIMCTQCIYVIECQVVVSVAMVIEGTHASYACSCCYDWKWPMYCCSVVCIQCCCGIWCLCLQ